MGYEVNDIIIGKVTNVKPYALFLQFENGTSGLLHISEISDDYIKDIENFGSIGDEIKVKILTIDPSNGFARVSLKAVPAEERYSTHDSKNKYTKMEGNADTLLAKMPEWISIALDKAKENK